LTDVEESDLENLFLQSTPWIDVRAPVEFALGSLPGAVNLPIMNDEERARVGTTYKNSGREAAMTLGHQLVSGDVKAARIQNWLRHIEKNPQAVLYCFRGGLRSKITQQWLKENQVERPLIVGGYKVARNFLRDKIDHFSTRQEFILLSGPTGSAKTRIIDKAMAFYPGLDLEALARHRGSAFGAWSEAQPAQVDFENSLSVGLLKLAADPRPWLFEDESRMIGRSVLPPAFFDRMRASKVLLVEESFEQRVVNIYEDYVLSTELAGADVTLARKVFAKYRAATQAISRRLGGERAQEVLTDLQNAEEELLAGRGLELNKVWIAKLLEYYYDPFYASSLAKRQPQILFRGPSAEILDKLKSFRAGC